MFNNNQRDLTKIFDNQWKANHNDMKKIENHEKDFVDRMFNVSNKTKTMEYKSPGQQASELQNRINQVRDVNRGVKNKRF